MEEPVPQASLTECETGAQHRRRRRTKRHGPFHLHRGQKKFLGRAAAFIILLIAIIILWYWIAVRG